MHGPGLLLVVILPLLSAAFAASEPREATPPGPLVLKAEPLPGRFTNLLASPEDGAWIAEFGGWSEWGGARASYLRREGKWLRLPLGAVFSWKRWIVLEGLEPLPRRDEEEAPALPLPPGATRADSFGTDDVFARRVSLVDRRTGRKLDAPWDTLAPLPLGDGEVWLLWRCPSRPLPDGGAKETLELITWRPRTGAVQRLGELAGDAAHSCRERTAALTLSTFSHPEGGLRTPHGTQSYAYSPAVLPSKQGALAKVVDGQGPRWIRIDSRGRVSPAEAGAGRDELHEAPVEAGSPLRPFTRLEGAFIESDGPFTTRSGRPVHGRLPDGTLGPLTPSLVGSFALHDGFLFTDEGVFRWPPGEPR